MKKKHVLLDKVPKLPEGFYAAVSGSLAINIVSRMEGAGIAPLVRFADLLRAIALSASDFKGELELNREMTLTVRTFRLLCGRARKAIAHSLESCQYAEAIGKDLTNLKDLKGKNVIRQGWLNFEPARKALERVEKKVGFLETTTAALIHDSLRTGDEKILAKQALRKLNHLPFKPGSSDVMHWTVGVLYDETRKFTQGLVPDEHVHQFIKDFLASLDLEMNTSVANVKSILQRRKAKKQTSLRDF